MLAIPLPQLKHQLEEMLLDLQLLTTALKQLRDLLPEHSDKRVTVLTLLGRLNDANKKSLRGTLDNTALQTEYNAIRSDLSDFVQALEEGDFDEKATGEAASAKASAAKGSVLYRIPHTMPLHQESECVVRIALDEDAIVEEIVIDDQTVLKNLSRVSDLMQVELADPAKQSVFSIRSTSPAQQLITEEGYTQWYFYVEPLRGGIHPLEVKVSVLELAFNQVHRKELVFRETIQIITEGAAAGEDADESLSPATSSPSAFKKAGQAFAFGGDSTALGAEEITHKGVEALVMEAPSEPAKMEPSKAGNRSLRSLAFFLAFLMLGSTATWAITPPETRDWWVASIIKDDADAYKKYMVDHPDSPYREKALFYRAERSEQLADLREYQEEYPTGKFQEKVIARVSALETRAIDSIRQHPRRENIQQFAVNFPETERLSEVKIAAEARADNRQELLADVEEAYVVSTRNKPTKQKVDAYLRDFPKYDRLHDVTEAVAAKPEVMAQVQGVLEEAHLKQMEQNPTPLQAQEFLDQFPEPLKRDKFEKILDKKPAVKKEAVEKMKRAKLIREARELEDQKVLKEDGR